MDEQPRRTRHGKAFWLAHIVACEQAGNEVTAYTLAHGLGEQNFHKWRRQLSRSGELPVQPAAPMFQRLEVMPTAVPLDDDLSPDCNDARGDASKMLDTALATISNCCIRWPNGTALEVSGALSADLIGSLLQVTGVLPRVDGGVR